MKNITAFYMNGCPYCKGAKEALAELIEENPGDDSVRILEKLLDSFAEKQNKED